MQQSRLTQIAASAGDGKIEDLEILLKNHYTQLEIDTGLENAIAYSQIKTAEYLLSLGANFSNYNYQGIYYAVHNDEIEGLKFAIEKGVDINIEGGMLLNTSIETAINTKTIEIIKWLLDNGADTGLLTKPSIELVENFGNAELQSLIRNHLAKSG